MMRTSSPSEAALFPVIFSLALASSCLLRYRTCGSCQRARLTTRGSDEWRRNRQPKKLMATPVKRNLIRIPIKTFQFSGEERSIGDIRKIHDWYWCCLTGFSQEFEGTRCRDAELLCSDWTDNAKTDWACGSTYTQLTYRKLHSSLHQMRRHQSNRERKYLSDGRGAMCNNLYDFDPYGLPQPASRRNKQDSLSVIIIVDAKMLQLIKSCHSC